MKNFLVILYATALVGFSVPAFATSITPMDNADNLAQSLVGSGVAISNVTYTGANVASGYFAGGTAAGIGIESGIVLTSGDAMNLNGTTNTSDGITGDNGLTGTPYLDNLVPGYSTFDATVLEFDFVSDGDAAYFSYVFGSDEYNEWVDSEFNDVFGFFLDGTAVTDNVALIPGTTTPVAINNVNNNSYPVFYNDNDPSDTGVPFPFEYDGFTDVFAVSIQGLEPGSTHHITLAIADAGDHVLDSGVFLEAGSFSEDPPDPIPEPATMLLLGSGLFGLAGMRRRKLRKNS